MAYRTGGGQSVRPDRLYSGLRKKMFQIQFSGAFVEGTEQKLCHRFFSGCFGINEGRCDSNFPG